MGALDEEWALDGLSAFQRKGKGALNESDLDEQNCSNTHAPFTLDHQGEVRETLQNRKDFTLASFWVEARPV